MRDALNEYYWDNGISPETTAAMLKTFADEVSRLANFIYDNAFCLDPRSPTLRAPERSAIELLRTIRDRHDNEMDLLSEESYEAVSAVLKTADVR